MQQHLWIGLAHRPADDDPDEVGGTTISFVTWLYNYKRKQFTATENAEYYGRVVAVRQGRAFYCTSQFGGTLQPFKDARMLVRDVGVSLVKTSVDRFRASIPDGALRIRDMWQAGAPLRHIDCEFCRGEVGDELDTATRPVRCTVCLLSSHPQCAMEVVRLVADRVDRVSDEIHERCAAVWPARIVDGVCSLCARLPMLRHEGADV